MREHNTKIVLHTETVHGACIESLFRTAVEADFAGRIDDHVDNDVPSKDCQLPKGPHREMVYDEIEGSIWVDKNNGPCAHTHLTGKLFQRSPVTHVEDRSAGTGTIRIHTNDGPVDTVIRPVQRKLPERPVTHVIDGDSGTIRVPPRKSI